MSGDLMEEGEYISLSRLFEAIGVVEKGIERIYHYLLKYSRIENLKDVSEQYDLTLKRGYKICSVLNELGLVQIFDRPMKIILSRPVVEIWQKLVNKRIEDLHGEFIEKQKICESAFEDFVNHYKFEEEIPHEPVEFVSFEENNLEHLYYPLYSGETCKIAIGIKYETPINSIIDKVVGERMKNEEYEQLISQLKSIKENLKNITVKIIINNEMLGELLNSDEYKYLVKDVNTQNLEFKDLDVRITEENLSNFSLTESQFIQPCFDPVNKLLGLFVSRDENIYKVFDKKFQEFYENALPINEYLKNQKMSRKEPLSQSEAFTLCLL